MITPNPIQPQTVMPTIAYSAWSGFSKKPCLAIPSESRIPLTIPKSGSSSHEKITPVAIVEVTTGTNTAVRYRAIPRTRRLRSTAIASDPTSVIGTNRAE